MIYKIDTHENFEVIELLKPFNAEMLLEELGNKLNEILDHKSNAILNFKQIETNVVNTFDALIAWHEKFYNANCSLVLTEMHANTKKQLGDDFFDQINYAPQLIEAIDIVSMEILERELLGDDEDFA